MTNEAEALILLYEGLNPKEASKLKSIDGEVWKVLLNKGITKRAVWRYQPGTSERSIQLCLFEDSQLQTLFELHDEEVASLSGSDIVGRLRKELA